MNRDEIIARNPLPEFLRGRGHQLKRAGHNFVTNVCPVTQHQVWHRCVTVDTEKNVWHCNDCKVGGSVIDWVMRERECDAAAAMRELGGGRNDEKGGQFVCAYDYVDEGGQLLYQAVRFTAPPPKKKDFYQRHPDDRGGWIDNLKGVRRVLYRLPEVLAAHTVCVAEGEKDCDNLVRLGFVATTNPMGAGKWCDEYNEFLRGKDVVVFGDVGDPDRAGERHTQQVIASLLGSGIAARHGRQPDGFHDVSDYIASLPSETAQEAVAKLISQAQLPPESKVSVEKEPRDREPLYLPPPPPYVLPPLDMLPGELQDYVHAAARSLNVDVSFILLPLLSALGGAVGYTRSILLKRNFVQPPVIWSAIIGRSGSRKSPAQEAGCFAVVEHERELMRQNKQAFEIHKNAVAEWESKPSKGRGAKPETPLSLTCLMDDMTLSALADAMQENPRGVLVKKDELSHWFASFDQYHASKGADVSRWLSLHTGAFFGLDRRTDKRRYRIHQPRVCVTGGIQPKVLRRVLTEDFFERGLPARFLFAHPPMRQDKWSEAEVSEASRDRILELFGKLWLLQPESDDHGQQHPKLLRLEKEAHDQFVRYYNECGASAVEADEHEEAAWHKLSGYAARLALVGQLARDPNAERVTGDTMKAACDLAGWFGREGVRIYGALAETQEQRDQRELVDFIERRGGKVTVREVTQLFRPLKNNRDEVERQLNALVRADRGAWKEVKGARGPATREFQLLQVSTSTGFEISPSVESKPVDCAQNEVNRVQNPVSTGLRISPSIRPKPVDVDSSSSQQITPSGEPDTEAETLDHDESGVVRL